MKTLFIDTHLHDIIVALVEDGIIINKKEIINKKNNSEYIFPSIIEVLGNKSFDEIIVVNGPGSFTGVRLGVTIAKTLAYTLKKPLKTISSLKAVAISTKKENVALSDGNGFFLGEFNKNYNEISDYKYFNNKEFENMENKKEYAKDYIIEIPQIIDYLKNIKSINPHSAKPIYVKKIGVEIDKKSD